MFAINAETLITVLKYFLSSTDIFNNAWNIMQLTI